MKAVGFMEFGGPGVLQVLEVPKPAPGADEVVVKVLAATVNPSDLMMRSGLQAALMTTLTPPYVAGMEFSGHIHSVGNSVQGLQPGQAVMGVVNPRRAAGGAHAQYVVVPAASVIGVDGVEDLFALSTVPMNGLTALAALHKLGLQAGQTLLVTGGAGVLASYAIQLAKIQGLKVVADTRDEDAQSLRALGVNAVVPRGEGMAEAVRQHFPGGVDGLLDTALLGDAAAALVRDGGSVVCVRRSHPITDARLRCAYVAVTECMTDTAALAQLASLVREGKLKPRGGQRVPMASAVSAHEMTERGGMSGRAILDFTTGT